MPWIGSAVRLLALGLSLGLPAASPAWADEVADHIAAGQAAYAKGRLSTAAKELQAAFAGINSRLAQKYLAALPPAPAGWTASDDTKAANGLAALGGGVLVKRQYTGGESGETITLTIAVDSPMMQGIMAMAANPALVALDKTARRVRVGDHDAVMREDQGSATATLTVVMGQRAVMMAEGRHLANPDLLTDLAGKIDYVALQSEQD